MSMDTNLQGRLRNTSLPLSGGLLPLFEAVVNSIHSIEEAGLSSTSGRISIEIMRSAQTQLDFGDRGKRGPEPIGDITGFKIVDNGIGFTDANMVSFKTLDTDYKADRGCRGVGRLLWLKAFERVMVTSIYQDSDQNPSMRKFEFNAKSGVDSEEVLDAPSPFKRETTIFLDGFRTKYRNASRKTTVPIARNLFEHCLWYFVRAGGAPHIEIRDGDEVVNLNDVYDEHMASEAVNELVDIKDIDFELIHIRLRADSSKSHTIAYCASRRLVEEETLNGKIPGLFGRLSDDVGDFTYTCYVSSPFLDEHVRSERTGFDIEESPLELFEDTEISLSDIQSTVLERVSNHLSEYLEENKQRGRDRVERFAATKAPRYRPILKRIPEEKLQIDPNISDRDLDLTLHKYLSEIEGELLSQGHNMMAPKDGETPAEYEQRLKAYLDTVEDIKKSDLANYVSHRKVVLDLLENAIQRGADGKYAREDLIHNLIMPMGFESNDLMFDNSNLWIIDERLAFHNYLASDKPLCSMPVIDSSETKEPDICALNVFDNPILVAEGNKLPMASIVVVEIKRPMRNDASQGEEKDPIEQALGYLKRIRDGQVKTPSGRPIPESEHIPGFCHVICDITPTIQRRCEIHDAILTSDHLGYFFFHKTYGAYVEVISFDRLVNAAKERNRAFFDKLGLPVT